MKKIILLTCGILFMTHVNAQSWNAQVYGFADKSKTRTLKINHKKKVTIQSLVLKNDSLTQIKKFEGSFLAVIGDSMQLSLDRYVETKKYTNGIYQETSIPGKKFVMKNSADSGIAKVSLSDINFLKYNNKTRNKLADLMEPVLFASIFVSFISPFLCIDYSTGTFNSERYKYWGLGCTIGLAASVCWGTTMSSSRKFQFKTAWPGKKKKIWSFENN